MNDPDVVLDKDGNILLLGGGFAQGFGGYINSMVLKPGQGTPSYSGDRCLAAKIVSGGPPNPPCGANVVQQTPVVQSTPPQQPVPLQQPSPSPSPSLVPAASTSLLPIPVITIISSVKKMKITCVKGKVIKKVTNYIDSALSKKPLKFSNVIKSKSRQLNVP